MARAYWCCYFNMRTDTEELTYEEKGRLYDALSLYAETGELTELPGNERFLFPAFRGQIDRDTEKYKAKCEKLRESGSAGGKANGSKWKQMEANGSKCLQEKEKEEEKENLSKESKGAKAPRTAHPTVEEVAAYCRERGNSINAQHFVDHYSSNGWKVGRNPMKDWKAAVRTWEQKDRLAEREGKARPYAGFQQRDPSELNIDDITLEL